MFKFSSIYLLAALSALMVTPAQARPQTFVASFGNDADPCGRDRPCRLLTKAMSVTDTNGEVTVLDSANYDSITITKSISITAPPGIYAGIVAPSDEISGVTIDAVGVNVVLRGLTISGNNQDGTEFSLSAGILMKAGAKLSIENCVISNFSSSNSSNLQPGVLVQTPAKVRMVNTITRNNEVGALFQAGATADISGSKFLGNSTAGIVVRNSIPGTTTSAAISNTVVVSSGVGIDALADTATASAKIDISRSIVSNSGIGIIAESPASVGAASVSIRKSMVTGSSTYGLWNIDGTLISYGNNTLTNNNLNVVGPLTTVAPL